MAALLVAGLGGAACTAAESTEPTAEEYTVAMEALCTETEVELDAVPTPPDESARTEFALAAAAIIESEAERVREIEPPVAFDDDHRAFIANTEDQAARWRQLADLTADDADGLNRVSGEIARLTLGRDELAGEMGLDACRRTRS